MAIKREDLIPSILNKVRQTFNDDKGFFRQGKFTPVQQVQNISQQVGQTKLPSGITLKQLPSAYMQSFSQSRTLPEKLMNIGTSSFLKASTFGLLQPQAPKAETLPEKFMSGLGGLTGFVGPGSLGGKAMTGLDKLGQAGITKFAPKLQTTLIGKVTGGLGKEALQTAGYVGGKYLSGKSGLRPDEKITGKSILQDLAIGAAMRGITTPGNLSAVKGMTGKNKMTFKPKSVLKGEEIDIIDQINERLGKTKDISWEDNNFLDNVLKQRTNATQGQLDNLTAKQKLNELLTFANRSEGFKGVTMGITDQPIKTGGGENYSETLKKDYTNAEKEFIRITGTKPEKIQDLTEFKVTGKIPYGYKGYSGPIFNEKTLKFEKQSQISPESVSTPKTIKLWRKSRFNNSGGYVDYPIIRREDNITLYQGGEGRQHWTPDKKYAERFGDVKEKTGSFYRIDNGNRLTHVYVEVPTKSVSPESVYKPQNKPLEQINKIYSDLKAGKYTGNDFNLKQQELATLKNTYNIPLETTSTTDYSKYFEPHLSPESKGIKPALIDKKIDLGVSPKAEKLVQPDLARPEVPIEKTQISTPETLQSAQTAPLDSQDIIPKERGFITTVKESEITTPEVKAGIEGVYEPITNKETIAKAKKAVSSGWDLAKERVMGKEYNADVVAIGEELARVAQKEGRTDEAIEILETLSKKATDAGQGIQALSIWKRLTPEGMLKFAEKELKRSEENAGFLTKLFKKGDTKISQEGKRFIMDEMAKVQKMADGPEKNKIIQSVLNRINDEIPIGASELFDAYRYQNLLSSPRTQLRNAYQNAYQALINKPATLASEATVDWIGSTLKGTERTKYFSDVPAYYKGLWNSRIDANNAFMDVWKGKEEFTNLDIQQLRAKNLPKKLTVVSRLMEGADKYFQSLIGGGEYAKLMKNGATEEVAKKGAKEAAEYYLLRNLPDPKNKTGQGLVLTAIDNATVGVTELGRRIPALRWFVPFIRTPMNAAKQWIEYSPAGILTTIGAKNKSSQLAKAMIGSVVTGIGASLALQDRTTWSAPTDAKEKEFFYASGKKPYFIKIGDKWVPMVYLGPQALALAIPAAFKQYQTDSKTALTDTQLEKATKSVTSLLGFFSEQTFLTGMGNFVRAISGDADYTFAGNIAGAAGQVLPLSSLQRYVAQIVDPVFRKTSGGKGLTGQFVNQMKSQIPFLTKTLEPYTLPNGELSKRNITDYVAPYSMGIQKDEYEPYLESRKAKLQQNAVINKAKKDLETTGGTQEIDGKILYPKDGEVKTLDLGKVTRLPEQTAYQRALKQKEAYKIVDDVLDNLEGDQQIEALQALGITSEDATYYNTARQENYLKSIYVEEEIMDMIKQGQNKDQILNNLVSMRKAVNEKILLSDGVINDLVDKNIISYTDGKALKNIDKDLTPKKTGTKVKKAKKISLSSKKFTASKKKYNPLKVKSTTTKSRFTPPKYVKADLRTPTKLL